MWNISWQCPGGHGGLPWGRWPQIIALSLTCLHWAPAWQLGLSSHRFKELGRAHKILCLSKSAKNVAPLEPARSAFFLVMYLFDKYMLCSLLAPYPKDSELYKTQSLSLGYILISHVSTKRKIQNCCLLKLKKKKLLSRTCEWQRRLDLETECSTMGKWRGLVTGL